MVRLRSPQEKLVALKTRFMFGSFSWLSGLLSRLVVFHAYPFLALWPVKGTLSGSNSLERLDPAARNEF